MDQENKMALLQRIIEKNSNIQLLTDRVTVCLRDAIIMGFFEPETKITEDMIASYFNISRTPAKHALSKMQDEELLVYTPRVGLTVRKWTVQDFLNIYEVTTLLERHLARGIAKQGMTEMEILRLRKILAEAENHIAEGSANGLEWVIYRFHEAMCSIYRNEWLEKALLPLRTKLLLLKPNVFVDSATPDERRILAQKNAELLQAMIDGDQDMAEQIILDLNNLTVSLKQKYGHFWILSERQ